MTRFVLTLRALPDRVPAILRLRQFLKRARRDWLMVCERVSLAPTEETQADHHHEHGAESNAEVRKKPRVHKRSLSEQFEESQRKEKR